MTRTTVRCLCAVLIAFATVGVTAVWAQAATPVSVSIPAGNLATALDALAKQTGAELVYRADQLRDVHTTGVAGILTPRDAATRLLNGTAFELQVDPSGAMLVRALASTAIKSAPTIAFDLPGGDLGTALNAFTSQSHVSLKFSAKLVRGKATLAVKGDMAPSDALRQLLIGTGITAEPIGESAFVLKATIVRHSTTPTASDATGPAGTGQAGATRVLIEAERPIPYADGNVDTPRSIDDVQPYYVFDSRTIEQSGALNVEDFLKQRLTMNTVATTNGQIVGGHANDNLIGAYGGTTSSINLRGLGLNETLILVNGRRMPGVNFVNYGVGQPDVNGLPLAAIDRIEVLPSSASGIYGGGALGGVINIILKNNYNGGEVKASYDMTSDGHAPIRTLSATYGVGFEDGRSHFMVSAQYSDSLPLLVRDRVDLINSGYARILQNDPAFLGFDPTYQQFSFPLLGSTPNIIGFNPSTGAVQALTLKSGGSLNSPIATLPAGYSTSSAPSSIIGGKWNVTLPNANVEPDGLLLPLGSSPKVTSVSMNFSRQMTDAIEFFAEASETANRSFQQLSQFYQTPNRALVPASSPINPFNQSVFVVFPDNHTAPLSTDSRLFAVTAGVKATLPLDWRMEMDYSWSRSTFDLGYSVQDDSLFNASIANGTLNPFVDTLRYPLDLRPYFAPVSSQSSSSISDVAVRASGPVARLPWGEPTVSLSAEHRRESTPRDTQDLNYPFDPVNDQIWLDLPQSQTVDSFYLEGLIPLVTSKNALPFVQSFDIQLADRVERYSVQSGSQQIRDFPNQSPPTTIIIPTPPDAAPDGTGGTPYFASTTYTSNNQTVGFKYKPRRDLIVRASYATAFLPPDHSQLLPSPIVYAGGDTITDPKTGASYSVSAIFGGNPNLKPQHSTSRNIGLIFEPSDGPVKGFRVNLESYWIDQYGYITSMTGDQILRDPALAGRVTRDPISGLVTTIDESLVNATKFSTSGWDLALGYQTSTPLGAFDVSGSISHINYEKRQFNAGGPTSDYAGFPRAGGEAKLKANLSMSWAYRQWAARWTATMYGAYMQQGTASDPVDPNDARYIKAQGADHIPSQTYHDVFVSYSIATASSEKDASARHMSVVDGVSIQFVVKNVFDSLPKFDVAYTPFYASPYGDLRLRSYRLTIVKAF